MIMKDSMCKVQKFGKWQGTVKPELAITFELRITTSCSHNNHYFGFPILILYHTASSTTTCQQRLHIRGLEGGFLQV